MNWTFIYTITYYLRICRFRQGIFFSSKKILIFFLFEQAHYKTYKKTCDQQRLKSNCTSVQSDQSLLIQCTFFNLRLIRKGINENPCHTGWMYWLISWSHPSYCRFFRALAHFSKKRTLFWLLLIQHNLQQYNIFQDLTVSLSLSESHLKYTLFDNDNVCTHPKPSLRCF